MKFNLILLVFLVLISKLTLSQTKNDSIQSITLNWITLAEGIELAETTAPILSEISDSKLTVVKINPNYFDFEMLMATQHGKKMLTAKEWADTFNLNLVINAGMYDLSRKLLSKGFLRNKTHVNQGQLEPNYNAMIAFNPKDTSIYKFDIIDLKCSNWEKVKPNYTCYAQGLRMIDCVGEPLSWNKRKQSCSMLITALDSEKNIYFIFTRSPYTHNQVIEFMQAFPNKLYHATYMEGGPQTSLYIKIGDTEISKIGSYVSDTYAHDNNVEFWKLPNVIGLRLKK